MAARREAERWGELSARAKLHAQRILDTESVDLNALNPLRHDRPSFLSTDGGSAAGQGTAAAEAEVKEEVLKSSEAASDAVEKGVVTTQRRAVFSTHGLSVGEHVFLLMPFRHGVDRAGVEFGETVDDRRAQLRMVLGESMRTQS